MSGEQKEASREFVQNSREDLEVLESSGRLVACALWMCACSGLHHAAVSGIETRAGALATISAHRVQVHLNSGSGWQSTSHFAFECTGAALPSESAAVHRRTWPQKCTLRASALWPGAASALCALACSALSCHFALWALKVLKCTFVEKCASAAVHSWEKCRSAPSALSSKCKSVKKCTLKSVKSALSLHLT